MNKVVEIVTFTSVKMMVNWKFEGDYHLMVMVSQIKMLVTLIESDATPG